MVIDNESGRYMLPQDMDTCREVIFEGGVNGDGNILTNSFDLLKWNRVLREGRLITRDGQAKMYASTRLMNRELATDNDLAGPVCYAFDWNILNDQSTGSLSPFPVTGPNTRSGLSALSMRTRSS